MCDICKTIEKSLNGDNPYFVKEMKTGIVVLGRNQHFYGYTLFMCKQHVTELYQLDSEFQAEYLKEMVIVAKAVSKAFDADKMNYECLSNGDTHLHFHLFPRKQGDLANMEITEKVRSGGCRRKLCGVMIIFRAAKSLRK